jgi:hypothetical protein
MDVNPFVFHLTRFPDLAQMATVAAKSRVAFQAARAAVARKILIALRKRLTLKIVPPTMRYRLVQKCTC